MKHLPPKDLLNLIDHLKKLSGIGTRTAQRFAFELLKWDSTSLESLINTLKDLHKKIPPCLACGCLTDRGDCMFCKHRNKNSLCIIASARDAYAIEETGQYRGLYHVIEHLISPLDGRHPKSLSIDRISNRIEAYQIQEVIIAFDSTLEGDATALYLKNQLEQKKINISRLALGLPMGSSLEYIDGGTLARAFYGRQTI